MKEWLKYSKRVESGPTVCGNMYIQCSLGQTLASLIMFWEGTECFYTVTPQCTLLPHTSPYLSIVSIKLELLFARNCLGGLSHLMKKAPG